MSDTPEYILRKPIEAIESNTWHTFKGGETVPFSERPYEVLNAGSEPVVLFKNEFEDLFVSLDRQALTEQLDLIVSEARLQFQVNLQMAKIDGILSEEVLEHDKITEQVVVNQIKALFGLENKDNK